MINSLTLAEVGNQLAQQQQPQHLPTLARRQLHLHVKTAYVTHTIQIGNMCGTQHLIQHKQKQQKETTVAIGLFVL